MNAARQFLFEKDFSGPDTDAEDESAEAEEPEVEEPEVDLFTEEEIAAARSAGLEQGREQAAAEFHASAEAEVLNLIRDIAGNLTQISAFQERENAKRTGEAVTVASAVCRKIIPDLFEKNGVDEVLHQVRTSVQNLHVAPRILLTVAPQLREAVAERIGAISAGAGYDGRIEVLDDDSLASGDCLMSWGDGGSERRLADVWDQVDAIVLGGAEKIAKSVERAYSRDAGAEPDSPPPDPETGGAAAAAPMAPPAGQTPESSAPQPPAAAQASDTVDKIRMNTGAAAAPPQPEQAPQTPKTDPLSDEAELDAILSEAGIEPGDPMPIVEPAPPPSEPQPAPPPTAAEPESKPEPKPGLAEKTAKPAAMPAKPAPPAPAPAARTEDAPAPVPTPPAERPSAPAPKMEALGIPLDTSEPGGEVDDALDKALGVLSGAQKPSAGGPKGPAPGGGGGGARPAPDEDEDEDEGAFGEILDDALDIALGALSKKKK